MQSLLWSSHSKITLHPHPFEIEVIQSCPTLCNPMDFSLPGSSVHGILQARTLEWVVISFFRASSRPRDWTWVYCTVGKRRPKYFTTTEWLWRTVNLSFPPSTMICGQNWGVFQRCSHLRHAELCITTLKEHTPTMLIFCLLAKMRPTERFSLYCFVIFR